MNRKYPVANACREILCLITQNEDPGSQHVAVKLWDSMGVPYRDSNSRQQCVART